jgi:hypothetical protein
MIVISASFWRDTGESAKPVESRIIASVGSREDRGFCVYGHVHKRTEIRGAESRAELLPFHTTVEACLRLRGGKLFKRSQLLGGKPLTGKPTNMNFRSNKDPMKQMEIEMRNEARKRIKAVSSRPHRCF